MYAPLYEGLGGTFFTEVEIVLQRDVSDLITQSHQLADALLSYSFLLFRLLFLQVLHHGSLLVVPHLFKDAHSNAIHTCYLLAANLHLLTLGNRVNCHVFEVLDSLSSCEELSDQLDRLKISLFASELSEQRQ